MIKNNLRAALVGLLAYLSIIAPLQAQGVGQLGANQVWGNPTASTAPARPSNAASFLTAGPCISITGTPKATIGISSPATVACGGTGQITLTNHGLLVGAGTAAITQLGVGGAGTVLGGVAASDPAFTAAPVLGAVGTLGTLGLSGSTSGVITITPQAVAGTYNWNLPITAGSTGQMLQSGGGGATAMAWTTATYPATATSTGTILQANGTNWVATTATYPGTAAGTGTLLRANGTNWLASTATWPDTTTINQILYSSAGNTVTGLATGNNGVLGTSSGGVPSITSTPTLGVNGGTGGQITLNGSTSGSAAIRVAAAAGTSTVFQLPATNGSNTNILQTDGAGNTSWAAASSGGTVTSIAQGYGIFLTTAPCIATCTVSVPLQTTNSHSLLGGI